MKWNISAVIPASIRKQLSGFDDTIAQLLFNRGVETSSEAEKYFLPSLEDLHDPELLPNIINAAHSILDAISRQEKIFIYGDYDVDGVCSTSLLFDFLYRTFDANVVPYIPSRFDEGYGMGSKGLDSVIAAGGKLVISVDCGIRDREIVAKYCKLGLDFVITDHHAISSEAGKPVYPDKAKAVVHPRLPGSTYPFPDICATAVVWKLVVVICSEAKKQGLLKQDYDVQHYLDLVALATVCDVMPLTGENRIFVKFGLQELRHTKNPGLKQLLKLAAIDVEDLDAYHLGFMIGPRINATGRLEHAMRGVRLLTSKNTQLVEEIAYKLDELNGQRQRMTLDILRQAEEQLTAFDLQQKILFVHGIDWAEGVVGLVAGKLSEKYHRPVLVASVNNTTVKGSARSISAFNITEALERNAALLERFGGHKQAAGFTLKHSNLEALKSNLRLLANESLVDDDLILDLSADMELEAKLISSELVATLAKFKPFGYGNKEPQFLVKDMRVESMQLLGQDKQHLKLILSNSGRFIEAIGFGMAAYFENLRPRAKINIVGAPDVHYWKNQASLQIKLKDIHLADEKTNPVS